jgi:hypothetical protein
VDNFAGQLDAAAAAVDELELLEEELELELSDLAESDFFSDVPDDDDDSDEFFAEPLDELFEDSRLSLR